MMTVYTALFGDAGRDHLRPPPRGCDARYVCFTDVPVNVPGWEIERVSSAGRSPVFLARLFKARPDRWFGPEATTIWTDASCELLIPAKHVLADSDAPVAGFRHPDRANVAAEAAEVIRIALAPADAVRAQLAAYRTAGFPIESHQVTTTGTLVRRPSAHAFNLLWEEHLIRYQIRDQVSVDYCGWATGTPIAHLPGTYRQNRYMRYHSHPRLKAS